MELMEWLYSSSFSEMWCQLCGELPFKAMPFTSLYLCKSQKESMQVNPMVRVNHWFREEGKRVEAIGRG